MDVRKGVSGVIYDKNGDLFFLILHRITPWEGWEFPKGKTEGDETPEQALQREVFEETGLRKFKVIQKMEQKREFINDNIKHEFDVFLVEASMNVPVQLSRKDKVHDTYIWTRSDRVMEKLYWENEKEIFKKVIEILKKKVIPVKPDLAH